MVKVVINFKDNLTDLLPAGKKSNTHDVTFSGKRSVKDLIESFGIPHTETGSIRVNEKTVDFSYILQDGDLIEVTPVLSGKPLPHPGETRLLCDEHLWKLCRRLRLLGFDTAYDKKWDDSQLAAISAKEDRVLLTRDRGLLMRKAVSQGICIRSTDAEEQVREVLDRLRLKNRCRPFSLCLLCGGGLKEIARGDEDFEKIKPKIPEKVLSRCKVYHVCLTCGQVYWQGSHYKKLVEKVRKYIKD